MATAAVQQPVSAFGPGGGASAASHVAVQQQQAATTPPKRDVRTVMNYYKPNEDGSPPHATYIDRPETYDRPVEPHDVLIRDVRGDDETRFTLDGNGFQLHRRAATEREFADDESIRASYYPETEQLLKDVTGASRVFIFDHTVRRPAATAIPTNGASPGTTPGGQQIRGPVKRVHVDQSYSASLSRVAHHLPLEAEHLLKGRVQIINVWRPVRNPVQRDPLAVADASSVSDDQLVPTALVYPNRRGETLQVKYDAGHRWFYKSRMDTDEVLLIKCFDSKTDGRARRVPHSAFVDPGAEPDAPARESIEIRALVFHPEDRD